MGYQILIIQGNVGADPEMKFLPSGTAVCNFSVAVGENWTDKESGERREKTTWYRVNVWGKSAENAHKYIKKGSSVLVEGTASASAYMGNDGEPKASLGLRAKTWHFAGSNSNGGGRDEEVSVHPDAGVDEIPF